MSFGTWFARKVRDVGLVGDTSGVPQYVLDMSDEELSDTIDGLIPFIRGNDAARREAQMLVKELAWRTGADVGMVGAVDASADTVQNAYVTVRGEAAKLVNVVSKPLIVVGIAAAAFFVFKK